MTIIKVNNMTNTTIEAKDKERELIQKHTEDFEQRGGEIEIIPAGASATDNQRDVQNGLRTADVFRDR